MAKIRIQTVLTAATIMALGVATSTVMPAWAEKVLEGEVCSANVHKLTTEIDWYKNLHKAEDAAGKDGKMIFWVHMVGKIDGAT
jgi:hypothetical protein